MSPAISVLGKVATGCAIAVAVYASILGALLTPSLQRFAVYAHKINTLFWHDVNNAEQFGFAKGQVTPFNITTPDGQTLYAWHVLPLDAYVRNEGALRKASDHDGPVEDFTQTLAFKLLSASRYGSRVVVNFHGNAGHVAQGWRTDTYKHLVLQPNTHVVTIDYRGFGHSTGSPTEAGLVTDGTALVNWVMHVARIPPERIVILGQSLGTAVASAVALNFADPSSDITSTQNTQTMPLLRGVHDIGAPTAFAGVILVAPFSSLPSLMLTYRIGGVLPLLLPIRPFPWVANMLTKNMADTWPTALRLDALKRALVARPKLLVHKHDDLLGDGSSTTRPMGTLQIIHAKSDMDISYHQTEMICQRLLGEDAEPFVANAVGDTQWQVAKPGEPRMRVDIVEHGGHNRIVTYSPVAIAVARAFEGIFD